MLAAAMSRSTHADRDVAIGKPAIARRGSVGATITPASDDPFGRLTRLVASNDRHMAELATLDLRLAEVNAHLASNPPRAALGRAYLALVKARRSKVLAILRANRIAACEFLSR